MNIFENAYTIDARTYLETHSAVYVEKVLQLFPRELGNSFLDLFFRCLPYVFPG